MARTKRSTAQFFAVEIDRSWVWERQTKLRVGELGEHWRWVYRDYIVGGPGNGAHRCLVLGNARPIRQVEVNKA